MKVLDLDKMSPENTKRLNCIFEQYSSQYTDFIDEISVKYENNMYWWITNTASRDTFISNAYKKICIVLLAVNAINENTLLEKIIVSDDVIARTLKKYLKEKSLESTISIEKHLSGKKNKYIFVIKVKNFAKKMYKMIRDYSLVRKERKKKTELCGKEITLIETDVFSSCFDSGEYHARDFVNILDYTDEEIYFLPYLFINNAMTMKELIHCVSESKKYKFIFREEYLELIDYIKTAFSVFHFKSFCKKHAFFCDIDVADIINRDIMLSIHSTNSIYGMLNYHCIQRMKKANLNIKSLIGWYEGQPSSMGIFMSFRKYYPDKRSVGFAGLPIDKKWMGISPSREQQRQKVTPEEVGVIGRIFESIPKQYDETVKTLLIPPFRMQAIFDNIKDIKYQKRKKILVALPYNVDSARTILEALYVIRETFDELGVELLLKNHPTKLKWCLDEYGIENFVSQYKFVEGNFSDAVKLVDMVITCASTTSYETILLGKPVIVVAQSGEILLAYVPSEWLGKRCYVAYNIEDIDNAIKGISNNLYNDKALEKSDNYMVFATRDNVKILVNGK